MEYVSGSIFMRILLMSLAHYKFYFWFVFIHTFIRVIHSNRSLLLKKLNICVYSPLLESFEVFVITASTIIIMQGDAIPPTDVILNHSLPKGM